MGHCGADIIPEDELFRLTAEVLGGGVTEDAAGDKITVARAGENCTLVFRLKNGKETVKQWQCSVKFKDESRLRHAPICTSSG